MFTPEVRNCIKILVFVTLAEEHEKLTEFFVHGRVEILIYKSCNSNYRYFNSLPSNNEDVEILPPVRVLKLFEMTV